MISPENPTTISQPTNYLIEDSPLLQTDAVHKQINTNRDCDAHRHAHTCIDECSTARILYANMQKHTLRQKNRCTQKTENIHTHKHTHIDCDSREWHVLPFQLSMQWQ